MAKRTFDSSSRYAGKSCISNMINDIKQGKGNFINFYGVIMWEPGDESGFVFTLALKGIDGRIRVSMFPNDNPRNPVMAQVWNLLTSSVQFKQFPPPYNHTWTAKECLDGTGLTHDNLLENADDLGGSEEYPLLKRTLPAEEQFHSFDPFERMQNRRNASNPNHQSYSFRF